MEYVIAAVLIAAALIIIIIRNRRIEKRKLIDFLKESYAHAKTEGVSHNHFEQLEQLLEGRDDIIPESVWLDLNMDRIFEFADRSISAIGEEYLYLTLHSLQTDSGLLDKREKLSEELKGAESFIPVKLSLLQIKKHEYVTVQGCIKKLSETRLTGTWLYFACLILFLGSFVYAFINPAFVIYPFIVAAVNSVIYLSRKSSIAGYDDAVDSLVKWLSAVDGIIKIDAKDSPELKELIRSMDRLSNEFSSFRRFAWLLAPKSAVGSLADLILDYVKFITHIDLIKFNLSVRLLKSKQKELYALYGLTGELELGFITASIKDGERQTCVPVFRNSENASLLFEAKSMTHPLLAEPVPNDCGMKGNILLTGSNASGKSTYLKMTGVNLILAQTLKLAFAQSLSMTFLDIRTSINISDDITAGDSFYIAEIKRLKSIIEAADRGLPLFICIDEILKGTNTSERIAASAEILRYLSKSNVLVLAATHDFELTGILNGVYENYYFTENVNNTNIFDYKLRKGVVYTSNAIKLLERYGFPESIIKNSYAFIQSKKA